MAVGRPGLFEWTVLYYAIPEKTLPFHEDLLLLDHNALLHLFSLRSRRLQKGSVVAEPLK